MNEIKFRVWHREKFYYMERCGGFCYFIHDQNPDEAISLEEGFLLESGLQQFTGIFDKNGVEIYEGDILKITNPEHQIPDLIDYETVPEESYDVCVNRSNDGTYYGKNSKCSWYVLNDYPIIEIIGNIYQNPEFHNQFN